MPTAMDFSPNLRAAVIVTYKDAYLYRRGPKQSWLAALNKRPIVIELPQLQQTEAGTFSADGKRLFVTTEKRAGPLVEIMLPRY